MELLKLGRTLALVSLPLMLTACVSSSDHKALQAQVSQMNRQMSTSQTSQADSWSQLVELRQEVAELRGQIDTLNNARQRVGGAQKLAETQALHGRALHIALKGLAAGNGLAEHTCRGLIVGGKAAHRQHTAAKGDAKLQKVAAAFAPKYGNGLFHLKGVAYGPAKGLIHIGYDCGAFSARALAYLRHGLSQHPGLVLSLHECAVTAFYIQYDNIRTCRQFL